VVVVVLGIPALLGFPRGIYCVWNSIDGFQVLGFILKPKNWELLSIIGLLFFFSRIGIIIIPVPISSSS